MRRAKAGDTAEPEPHGNQSQRLGVSSLARPDSGRSFKHCSEQRNNPQRLVSLMDDSVPFLVQVWQGSSRLVAFSIVVLVAMLVRTLLEMVDRGFRYTLAIWQSRAFIQRCVPLLQRNDWAAVGALAAKLKMSHVAGVVANGLREFRMMSTQVSVGLAVEAAGRQASVARNRIHEDLRRGLGGLGSIAATAPLVGLFGTTIGIFDSFRGCAGDRATCMAATANGLAAALATTALGMVVAVLAVWCFNWLTDRLSGIDADMRIASLELAKYLQELSKA